ncbi:tyrosine-type recombinase/integrase [Kamptonema sp. UHCC 0994]|uniref:tyrosine-type recombinase/integrase n=1 Tax=Kamptonema sp. UHCC 0994 TaxID=3031329 RepID=UPI0023BAC72A|nr:tyrosine-type recombinase/integrase [Kamptonema sp. UHCC 0994]MDF0556287.1 tyrosine-type recombinase/integrase [Kamptonema sp. UHCC 0994]
MLLESSQISTAPLAQVESDAKLISLWLHGRSPETQRAYRRDVADFTALIAGKPLALVTVNDIQLYQDAMQKRILATATIARRLGAVKSLLAYGQKLGVLPVNVGAAVKPPTGKNALAERILTESQVLTMLALEPNPRNRVLLRFMYATGCRVSELCALKWRDLREAALGAGQVTLFGKGSKTRVVIFSAETWKLVRSLRGTTLPDDPVFCSRKHSGHLKPAQVHRIVAAAGKRAGIEGNVSPHWLRHSHASHALERNTPIHLVQATLGHSSVATTGRYLHARPTDSSALHLAV